MRSEFEAKAMLSRALALMTVLFAAVVAPGSALAQGAGATPQWRLLESFRDCPTCPIVVPVGAGSFQMGAADGENEREGVVQTFRDTNRPQHLVRIKEAFAIGKYEVTRSEFAEFIADTGHFMEDSCLVFAPDRDAPILSPTPVDRSATFTERKGFSWRNPGFRQTNDDPVVCVTWSDAKAYVAWLSRKTRQRYELPSEAEWEYAARATTVTARYWSEGPQDMCTYANGGDLTLVRTPGVVFDRNVAFIQCDDKYSFTAPVGKFKPNAWGLHDMLGNVGEWVEDCWNDTYAGAPIDGGPWSLGNCRRHVVRGGSWVNTQAGLLRAASRVSHGTETRVAVTGFRVLRRP